MTSTEMILKRRHPPWCRCGVGNSCAEATRAAKIVTSFIYPPIPDRRFDWQAHYDDDEPNDNGSMLVGHGPTEQDAIRDLIDADPDRAEAEGVEI